MRSICKSVPAAVDRLPIFSSVVVILLCRVSKLNRFPSKVGSIGMLASLRSMSDELLYALRLASWRAAQLFYCNRYINTR